MIAKSNKATMRKIINVAALFLITAACARLSLHATSPPPSVPAAKTAEPCVDVYGDVRKPGRYDWFDGMNIRDAIEVAGGLKNTNIVKAEIRITHFDGTQVLSTYQAIADESKPPLLAKGDNLFVLKRLW
jgi:protein involved in polysaccharide export with SLBB domain